MGELCLQKNQAQNTMETTGQNSLKCWKNGQGFSLTRLNENYDGRLSSSACPALRESNIQSKQKNDKRITTAIRE